VVKFNKQIDVTKVNGEVMRLVRQVVVPVAIVYLLTWVAIIGAASLGSGSTLILVGCMWIPGAVALVAARIQGVQLSIFGQPVRSYFVAPLWAIVIASIVFVTSLPFGKLQGVASFELFMQQLHLPVYGFSALLSGILLLVVQAYIAGLTVNMIAGLGEELMWRGLLWERLKHLGFLRASLLIGFIWGAWHAPAIWILGHNYSPASWLGLAMMTLVGLTMSPILCFFRQRGDSIGVPAVFHGTMNACGGVSYLLFVNPNPIVVGLTGINGIAVYILFSGWLIWKASLRGQQKIDYRISDC
jgi:CAAX protease family protein